jgi:hypothetical protein
MPARGVAAGPLLPGLETKKGDGGKRRQTWGGQQKWRAQEQPYPSPAPSLRFRIFCFLLFVQASGPLSRGRSRLFQSRDPHLKLLPPKHLVCDGREQLVIEGKETRTRAKPRRAGSLCSLLHLNSVALARASAGVVACSCSWLHLRLRSASCVCVCVRVCVCAGAWTPCLLPSRRRVAGARHRSSRPMRVTPLRHACLRSKYAPPGVRAERRARAWGMRATFVRVAGNGVADGCPCT